MMVVDSAWRWLGKAMRNVLDSELRRWSSLPVSDAFIGARYSYVELDGKWCGIAFTPGELGRPVSELEHATPRYLARLVEKGLGGGAASLALAALNAATMAWIYETLDPPILLEKRLTEVLSIRSDDVVAVIGFMKGVVDELLPRVHRVYIIEMSHELKEEAEERYRGIEGVQVLGVEDGNEPLQDASILIVTGSALLYPGTLLKQLRRTQRARERVIIGPTSSFHPRLAAILGFTLLGGVYIDPSLCSTLRWHIAGGGGLHSLRHGSKTPLIPKFFAKP